MDRLQAGAGSAPFNIPEMPLSGDGTPLVARCLVLDDGETRVAIVSGTWLGLYGREAARVEEAVCEALALPPERVMIAATHIHSGPPLFAADAQVRETVAEHLAVAAAEAARQARELRPARVGWATDRLPGITRVRRIVRRDGSVITLRRAWPQHWGWADDPETVGPEEELDDLLTVVRVEDEAGEPLAAIMHFTGHPIPDFMGYAAALVERTLPPGAVCLILNGCLGSVDTPFEQPMRGRTQQDQLPILGDILGYRTLELIARAETAERVRLAACSVPVSLPVEPAFAANPIASWEMWRDAVESGSFDSRVQCISIGDLALSGIPAEAQVSFGRDVADASPFALTRVVGNVGRSGAYAFHPEARARGGYEVDPEMCAMLGGEALGIILQAQRECLAQMGR